LYPNSTHTLISFKDIRKNMLHACSHEDNKEEFLLITKSFRYGHEVIERIPSTLSGLYSTYIRHVPYVTYKMIFHNVDTFKTWHSHPDHSKIEMMRKIIGNCTSHDLKYAKFLKSNNFVCTSCAMGNLIIHAEPLKFLRCIQGNICCPIQLLCGSFRYLMVLVGTSRWSHVCLLSTRNHTFPKFITQVVRLKMNYPEYRIKSIHMDNAIEFSSRVFNDYCMTKEMKVQYSVPYAHIQNGLIESLIKNQAYS
jgi:hypothetical protein